MSKKLNGLPHNIAESFFSSMRYYRGGYMADWVLNAAQKFKVREIKLDVKQKTIMPAQMNIPALRRNLKTSDFVIVSELKANGFESDFISEAEMIIKLDEASFQNRSFFCTAVVIDKEGERYEDSISVSATEKPFDVFIINKKHIVIILCSIILLMVCIRAVNWFTSNMCLVDCELVNENSIRSPWSILEVWEGFR
jgi:hypothetical protein